MDLLSYQRTVFGFHGCDKRIADTALTVRSKLRASENVYDWHARGIYFWKHAPSAGL